MGEGYVDGLAEGERVTHNAHDMSQQLVSLRPIDGQSIRVPHQSQETRYSYPSRPNP